MRRMVHSAAVAALVLACGAAVADIVIEIPMNQQINKGLPGTKQSPNGDAIYVPDFGGGTLSFEPPGDPEHTRITIYGGNWWYLYLDFALAGYAPLNITGPGSTLEFDARYYQDENTNSDPYADAPIFVRIYTYDYDPHGEPQTDEYVGHRDFSIVYQTNPDLTDCPAAEYPAWTHITIDLNDMLANYICRCNPTVEEGGTFDPTRMTRMRWYGTDWNGFGDDYVEVKNIKLTLKPPTCPGDLDKDGKIGLSDLATLLANWNLDSRPVVLFDSAGFEGYTLGPLPGQDGWLDDTTGDGFVPPDIVNDPTGGGRGKVIHMDPPDGEDWSGWVGAFRPAASLKSDSRVKLEWHQYRPDTGDNLFMSDNPDFAAWWAIQWDVSTGNEISTVEWTNFAPLTPGEWEHIQYTIDLKTGFAYLDVGDGKHRRTGCLNEATTNVDGLTFEFVPTAVSGDGPAYIDDVKITEQPPPIDGDIDGDNVVGLSDLAYLLSKYNTTCGE